MRKEEKDKDKDKGEAYATFTPAQDGWYEFVCDTPYTGISPDATPADTSSTEATNTDIRSIALGTASICLEEGEDYSVVAFTWGQDLSRLSEEYRKVIMKYFPHPETIQYADNSGFKGAKTVTVKGNKAASATIRKLKTKKTFYFRIRTFQTVSGKSYTSAWSGKKSIKVKLAPL